MGTVQVNKGLAYGFLFVLLALIVINIAVQMRNAQLSEHLRILESSKGLSVGTALPEVKGADVTGPWSVDLTTGGRRAILIFDPICKACEQNWPSWERLLSDKEISDRLLPISITPSLPPAFLAKHHVPEGKAYIGLDPDFKLEATPLTILQRNGFVEKTWVGVLSSSELKELTSALKSR